MKAIDLLEHFLSRADWVDRGHTVDKIIVGDPDREVKSCCVTWMPSLSAIRTLVDRGADLLVCHEPTFWNHQNDEPIEAGRPAVKARFIAEHDVTVLRNHDCWDRWPDIGIPWSWGQFLELGSAPAAIGGNGYLHRYDIEPVSLDEFAARVAARCATIGEPAVQVVGDGGQRVSRIGTGTGCGCDISTYMDMGCDCSVVCDDGSCYWSNIQQARDLGHPVIRVNHGTSEENGMVTLTRYINESIGGVTAEHLSHGSMFRLVGA